MLQKRTQSNKAKGWGQYAISALPFRKALLQWIWDSVLSPAFCRIALSSFKVFQPFEACNQQVLSPTSTSFLFWWRNLLPLSMAVTIDILAMVATAAAATNVCLIMAQSLLILMPNDTTTSRSSSFSSFPANPTCPRPFCHTKILIKRLFWELLENSNIEFHWA